MSKILVDLVANDLITGVVQGIMGTVSKLVSSVQEAANVQTLGLASASDIGTNLGVGFEKAKTLVDETRVAISQLAADLPGVNSAYSEIFQNISGTVAKQAKGDVEAFKSIALDITKRAGVLASIRNIDAGNAGSALNRFIAGTSSFGEARLQDIFQKNPQLIDAIQSEAKKLGVSLDKWKDVTSELRLKVVQNALKIATPDSLINSFSGTVDSMLQTIQTKLFDMDVGLFGVLRKIGNVGGRSVLDAVQGGLQSFLGMMSAFDGVLKKLGINIDPLEPLVRFIDWLADLMNSAGSMLSKLNTGELLKDPMEALGINAFLDNLRTTGWAGQFINGERLAAWVNDLVSWLRQAIQDINWGQLGSFVWDIFKSGILELGKFIISIDWLELVRLLVDGIKAGFQALVGAIHKALVDAATALANALRAAFGDAINAVRGAVSSIVGGTPSTPAQQQTALDNSTRPSGAFSSNLKTPETPQTTSKPLAQPQTPFENLERKKEQIVSNNITVNVQGNNDPEETARRTVAYIERWSEQYAAGVLT